VPYCSVTLQELVVNDDTRIDQFHGLGTDPTGQANIDTITGRFRVTAQKVDFIPELFAMRIRGRCFPAVYEVGNPTVVAAHIDPVPTGTATLSGRVVNQFSQPLREFYMSLRRHRQRGLFDWDTFIIELPFTSDDGSYSVPRLPAGEYEVYFRHFDTPTHDWRFGQFKVAIPDEPNVKVKADFEVEANQLYYGRAVLDDKTPVKKGLWVATFGGQQMNNSAYSINEDGTFRVSLSAEEERKVDKYQRGTVQVRAYLADKKESTVDVPLDKLSKNPARPAVVVIPTTPKSEAERFDQKDPFADDVLLPDALAWISELKVLGEERRTLELADFKGKPMLLNLYSRGREWIEELPESLKLHQEYADKGLVMLVICRDITSAEDFLKQYALPFPIVADVDGYAVDVLRRRHRSEPASRTNVVLDRNGKRLLHQVGVKGDKLKNLRAAIEQALASDSKQ
jgi:peroxiredoxin